MVQDCVNNREDADSKAAGKDAAKIFPTNGKHKWDTSVGDEDEKAKGKRCGG